MFHARRLIPLRAGRLASALACGGSDPSGPSTGSLAIAVSGLPSGTPAAVTVTGPGDYSHVADGSETLSGLTPGAYTVAAEPVSQQRAELCAGPELPDRHGGTERHRGHRAGHVRSRRRAA